MTTRRIRKSAYGLGVLVAVLGTATLSPKANAAEAAGGLELLQEFRIAHCCHAHPYTPYDNYCCHEPSTTVYVAPAYGAYRAPAYGAYRAPVYGVGPASVRGVSRRTSRRVSRRR